MDPTRGEVGGMTRKADDSYGEDALVAEIVVSKAIIKFSCFAAEVQNLAAV